MRLLLATLLFCGAAATVEAQTVALRASDAHGSEFDLASLRGSIVVVTFVSRYTKSEAARIHDALAQRAELKIVSVVDFVGIPSFVQSYARRKIAEADGRVRHLCDEHGDLAQRFGARPDKRVDIFIVDGDGVLRGRFAGAGELGSALDLVDELRRATAAL